MPGLNGDDYYTPENLAKVNMSIIDTLVYRILYQMIKVNGPLFDKPVCDNQNLGSCNQFLYKTTATSAEHANLARQIAAESIALLKNERNVLPLSASLPSQAVVALLGSACSPFYNTSGMTVCLRFTMEKLW